MPGGFFIPFYGLDGSGKTTQLRRLATTLDTSGVATVMLRQPGGSPLGDRIRSIMLDSRSDALLGGIVPAAELALMFADRAQTVQQVILPALADGKVVLCDRFTDSSEAYQGAGRELGSEAVLTLHRELCHDVRPDLTILLLPPFERSLERARRRNRRHIQTFGADENRFEAEPDTFYERVHRAYERIAVRDATRVVTIRSGGSIDDIESEVRGVVLSRLAARGTPSA